MYYVQKRMIRCTIISNSGKYIDIKYYRLKRLLGIFLFVFELRSNSSFPHSFNFRPQSESENSSRQLNDFCAKGIRPYMHSERTQTPNENTLEREPSA